MTSSEAVAGAVVLAVGQDDDVPFAGRRPGLQRARNA